MLQYVATVRIAGSTQHVQTGKVVTIPEIAVLRHVHGTDAVSITGKAPAATTKVDGMSERPRTDADERERLRKIYDRPTPDSEPITDKLFGPLAKLPTRLSDVGVDAASQAKELAAQAAALTAAAQSLQDEDLEPPEVDEADEFLNDVAAA